MPKRTVADWTGFFPFFAAFETGGDFHSRTAIGMYDYVRQAVDNKEVLLEWDYSTGRTPDRPLLKDQFGTERRKAKASLLLFCV